MTGPAAAAGRPNLRQRVRRILWLDAGRLETQARPPALRIFALAHRVGGRARLDLDRLGPQVVRDLFLLQRGKRVERLEELLEPRIFLQAVGLVLILLNLTDNFGHLAPLGKVDELRVVQDVRIALLQEPDVGLVLAEEGDTRRVDGAKLLQVQFKVVRHETSCILQCLR